MSTWYDQGSSEFVRRTRELFSSSQPFTQLSDKGKYDKLIIKNSKRSYLGRTMNLLTPLSYFSRSSIVVHHQEYAPAPTETETHRTSKTIRWWFGWVQCYRLPPHTSNTSKYPKWLAKKSFRTRKYTPNDDCVVCALGMSVVSCFNNLWINCVFFFIF